MTGPTEALNKTAAHLRDHKYADFRDVSQYQVRLRELIDDLLGKDKRPLLNIRVDSEPRKDSHLPMVPPSLAEPYRMKASRAHPALIIIIIDYSRASLSLTETSDSLGEWMERYITIILKELLARSTEVLGESHRVVKRYYLNVIKYGGSLEAWNGEELDIEEAVNRFADAKGSFGFHGRFGGTGAMAAFQTTFLLLQNALNKERFKNSFPPIVFHMTTSGSTAAEESMAQQIKSLSSSNGNVLIVNSCIGTSTALNYNGPDDFPGYLIEQEIGSNPDNLRLFRMSSIIPHSIRQDLIDDSIFPAIRKNARLFFDVRTREMLKHIIPVVGEAEG